MEFTGKLTAVLQEQRGESAKGAWVKSGFVLEVGDKYPKKLAVSFFGEDNLAMIRATPLNTQMTIEFAVESREYQGRWYTDCRLIKVVSTGQQPQRQQQQMPSQQQAQYIAPPQMPQQQAQQPQQPKVEVMQGDSDLPF